MQQSSKLIENILEEQTEVIRAFMQEGLAAGKNPTAIALDLIGRMDKASGKWVGGVIGLNSVQSDAVRRAAAELASGDPTLMLKYLGRKRRDARFDAMVRKAIADGKAIPKADQVRMIQRYSDRLLKLRGDTIARTEMLNALRAGRHEGYRQLIESGKVGAEQVAVTWKATGDLRTRDSHRLLHNDVVRFGTPFISPLSGVMMDYPGDVSHGGGKALAGEVIQCRCYAEYRIKRRANV